MPLKIRPPRSSFTVVKIVGMPYAFAVMARPMVLLMTIVGSWLLTFASWNGWWSISTTTQLSGVRSASRPTFVNACILQFLLRISCLKLLQSIRSTLLREALAQLGNEQLGLLKRGEMAALRNLVPIKKLRVRTLSPNLRGREHVTFEYAHGNGDVERHSAEVFLEALEIKPRRGCSS